MYIISMNRLDKPTRVRIVSALAEGCSLRSTSRMAGVSVNTVMKFLVEIGEVCEAFHDETVRGLRCDRVQCDEIWSFCYCKDKNVPDRMRGMPGVGDVWTWTAVDQDSKLMIAWMVGDRDAECAGRFMHDLAGRIVTKPQLTTDGLGVYPRAVADAFGFNVDYATLVKIYGEPREKDQRYSPCDCLGTKKEAIIGHPNRVDVCTSHVERANLSMRMGMRRFTRLTNGFSKKLANLRAAVALYMVHFNYCRVHKTIRVTPAMEAGLTDHVWTLEELIGLLEKAEQASIGRAENKRGPYKGRVSNDSN